MVHMRTFIGKNNRRHINIVGNKMFAVRFNLFIIVDFKTKQLSFGKNSSE